MDIYLLSENCLKIKIKKTLLVINPNSKTPKTEADAIISTIKDVDLGRVKDFRVTIDSPGEYEVGGLKISASKEGEGYSFVFNSDGREIILAQASTLSKIATDKIRDYAVAIINADSEVPQNVITAMEPRAIVLYGEKAKEAVTNLGKENVSSSSKASIAEDKLPEETEVYLLS